MSATQTVLAVQEPASIAAASTPPSPSSPSRHEAAAMIAISEKRRLGERLAETVRRFWDLGFTSFGGPGVHVVILR